MGQRLGDDARALTSVAVLPFVIMSGDAENEYFSDGITEELLDVLAGVPGLRVPARTSSFQFGARTGPSSSCCRWWTIPAIGTP